MVIVKLLGFMDLLSAITMLLLHFDLVGWRLAFTFACYLAFKAVLFHGDIASFIDLFAAVYIMLLIFHVHTFFTFIFAGYLIQKVVFSFL